MGTSDILSLLSALTSYICMAISLWFAIYLLARSQNSHLTFRAVVTLVALAFYYNAAFSNLVDPFAKTGHVRAVSITIALVATHDLTHYLLPAEWRKRLYWSARIAVLLAVIGIILIFTLTSDDPFNPRVIYPVDFSSPWWIVSIYQFVVFLGILINLWIIKQSEISLHNRSFYLGILFGAGIIGYTALGTIFNLNLPRFIAYGLMLVSLLMVGYSVMRHQALVMRRMSVFDLPITFATIMGIVGIYFLAAFQIGLPLNQIMLITVLVVFTHASYDFVREFIELMLRRQDRQIRHELRSFARTTPDDETLHSYLRRGLAILSHNLNASGGFIAVRQEEGYSVVASRRSLPISSNIPFKEANIDGVSQPQGFLRKNISWIAPAYGGGEQVGVVGIGPRLGQKQFTEEDLDWLEDIADGVGAMVFAHQKGSGIEMQRLNGEIEREDYSIESQRRSDALLSTLSFKPDPEFVDSIEEGFRNLHDYSKLGRSPLVTMFGIQGKDHIECGKKVQMKLIEILEKLRPHGEAPSEPLPRSWYSFTILHDAYVNEAPTREIMAKLYISEGTYYRTRRRALRGVARALMEIGAVA